MFRHLLLPTDGSDLSVRSFTAGIELAKTLGPHVTGLCVASEPQVAGGLGEVMIGSDDAVQTAEAFVAAIAAEAKRQGVPHECFYVKAASVADEIVKVATERACDLICMGSQGRGGLAGLLLGSDTVDVLNRCKIPLLVYR